MVMVAWGRGWPTPTVGEGEPVGYGWRMGSKSGVKWVYKKSSHPHGGPLGPGNHLPRQDLISDGECRTAAGAVERMIRVLDTVYIWHMRTRTTPDGVANRQGALGPAPADAVPSQISMQPPTIAQQPIFELYMIMTASQVACVIGPGLLHGCSRTV